MPNIKQYHGKYISRESANTRRRMFKYLLPAICTVRVHWKINDSIQNIAAKIIADNQFSLLSLIEDKKQQLFALQLKGSNDFCKENLTGTYNTKHTDKIQNIPSE